MGMEHSKILEREEVAQGTMAFHLAKPAGFDFRPGQAFEIQLPGAAPGESKEERCHAFSIVSAPHPSVDASMSRRSAQKSALLVSLLTSSPPWCGRRRWRLLATDE